MIGHIQKQQLKEKELLPPPKMMEEEAQEAPEMLMQHTGGRRTRKALEERRLQLQQMAEEEGEVKNALSEQEQSIWGSMEEQSEWPLLQINEQRQAGGNMTEPTDPVMKQFQKKRMLKSLFQYSDEYAEIKKRIIDDKIGTRRQKGERLYMLMKPFEANFAIYKKYEAEVKDRDRKEKVRRMIEDYGCLERAAKLPENAYSIDLWKVGFKVEDLKEMDVKAVIRNKARKLSGERLLEDRNRQREQDVNDNLRRETENTAMSASMTALQKGAVTAIDQWIARRARYEAVNPAFVSKVLSLSPRERLFLYSVIEDGVEKSLSDFELYYNMTERVPSPEKFEKKMSSSKLKFWKKIRHTDILWEKLEVAYGIVTGKREQLIAAVSEREKEREAEDNPLGMMENMLYEKVENGEEADEVRSLFEEIRRTQDYDDLIATRDNALRDFEKAMNDAIRALDTYKSTFSFNLIGKSRRKKKLEEKARKVEEAREYYFEAINNLATPVMGQIQDSLFFQRKFGDDAEAGLEDMYGNAAKIASGSAAYKEEGMEGMMWLLKQGISVGSLSNKYVDALGLSSYGQVNGLTLTTGVFSLLGGSMALLGLVKQYQALFKGFEDIGDAELASTIFKTSVSTTSTLWSAAAGTTTLAYASKIATLKDTTQLAAYAGTYGKDAAQALGNSVTLMSKGMAAAGATVSTAALAAQVGDAVVQTKQGIHLHSAQKGLQKQINGGKLVEEDAEYTKNLLSLTNRKKKIERINSAINTTASAYSSGVALAALIAPGAGVAIASLSGLLVGAGAGLATMIISYLGNKSNRTKSCNDFIKITDLKGLGLLKDEETKMGKKLGDEEFRRQMINELLAEFGYNSIDSFYGYVVKKYAKFVFDNLFWDRDGNQVLRKSNGSSDEPELEEKKPWVDYCKSLGLKVQFPITDGEGQRKPVVAVIAQKLM